MKVDLLLPRFPDIAARTFPLPNLHGERKAFLSSVTQFVREQGIELVISIHGVDHSPARRDCEKINGSRG